jgi:hypothetical protein
MSDDIPYDLSRRLLNLTRAIDRVMIADHAQRYWLKNTVPLDVPFADAVAHYGKPGAGLDLWAMCAAVEELRSVWHGSNFPLPEEQLAPEHGDGTSHDKEN